MDIQLHHKKIKEMCGTVSFKRGDSFYRAGKVNFTKYSPDYCEAKVIGTEDFNVTIKMNESGELLTSCSCPTLFSVKNDCQHIAAVLLAISEHQRQGTQPYIPAMRPESGQALTEGLLTIFSEKPKRASRHQSHFENREILDAEFMIIPLTIDEDHKRLAIEVYIGLHRIEHIREFLENIKNGESSFLSSSFTFNPGRHCFQKDVDMIIQQLIQMADDEKSSIEQVHHSMDYQILIPPSLWGRLLPSLMNAPFVKLKTDGKKPIRLHVSEEPPPLQFDLDNIQEDAYTLKINGLDQLNVLESYRTVLAEGELFWLDEEDCKRLAELKKMLDLSDTNEIRIPKEQIEFFLEKVAPGLRRLGEIHLPQVLTRNAMKTPLVAKVYLDRVKNRLLAGLEFHYDNIVLNPLESRESKAGPMLIRDVERENEILQLMEESSFTHTESGYFLHNEELEYEFLYHTVPKLQKLVHVFATTAVRNRIFRDNTFPPKIQIKVKKERTNWLEFKFTMDGIADGEIRKLLSALEEKRKYYRLRNGTLLSLETREFSEITRFLNAHSLPVENLERGLEVPIVQGLKLLDTMEDSSTFLVEESFYQFLEKIRNPGKMKYDVPQQVASVLRDYQVYGYKWMKTLAGYGFGGILADDMGLGKTLQSITFILSELEEIRQKKMPALIVCPASLTYNWLSEIMKFAPDLEAIVVDGHKSERSALQKEIKGTDVLIVSYPILRKDIAWYEKQSFPIVFFDEAQAFKNPLTQTAKSVKKIKADYRFALTGTPVENSSVELWAIFHVVFPELFQGVKEYSHLSSKTIARRIRPFLLRRLKEDVLEELPEKIEAVDSVELLPEQKKLYAAYLAKLRHDTLKHLDKDTIRKNRIKILAGLTRLRQICCHPALFVDGYKGSSAKFDKLLQILEEAKLSGRRVLIFSQFTKMLQLIGRELAFQGQPFFYLDGQTPSEERVHLTNLFNAGERNLFLISLKAGGTGLNLTGADTVILYDLWWNPAVEEQAADRAHRMGQTNKVEVIKLITRGTIEEKINELQDKKRHLIAEIIDPNEKNVSTLTEEDIREILMI